MATKTKTRTARKTTEFTIAVPLTQKQLATIADLSLIELEDFTPETIKAAGIRTKALKAELMRDGVFRARIAKTATKVLAEYLDYAVEEFMIMDENHPAIKAAYRAAAKVADTVDAEQAKRIEEARVYEAVQFLKTKGLTVVRG